MAQTPRYEQIADDLRRRIESGEFAPNTATAEGEPEADAATPVEVKPEADAALPTELELQREYQASRNTVREAIKLLAQQHLIETKAGQGTFITKPPVPLVTTLSTDPKTGLGGGGEEGATYPAIVREQGREAKAEKPEVQIVPCPPGIAARLRIDVGEYVVNRHQERYIDGTIWSLQTSYYPMTWVQRGAARLLEPKDIPEGTVEYLANAIGLKQVGYRDLVFARLPNDKEQVRFNLRHSHTVMEVYRTSFAEDETPIRVTVTVFPSDRNQLIYNVGAVPDPREEPVQP